MFINKVLLIIGGIGLFGNVVLKWFLHMDVPPYIREFCELVDIFDPYSKLSIARSVARWMKYDFKLRPIRSSADFMGNHLPQTEKNKNV